MDPLLAALADPARWRMIELLALRPRAVGELAELLGLRQPQTTKHLQTLARAGVVSVHPLGQRRVYALETSPLRAAANRLANLLQQADAHADEREVLDRYRAAISAERAAADSPGWADGRSFAFERHLAAPRETVWRHWTDAALLATWWAPPSFEVVESTIAPHPEGAVVLAYRDPDGAHYRSDGRVRVAEAPERLEFDLSVRDSEGGVAFTAHYAVSLDEAPRGTRLVAELHLDATAVASSPFIAGIETGWNQVLDNLVARVAADPRPDRKEPLS
ncbi:MULTISPECIES: metalloregulator ArsR/SmtB family transcription factor [unclassified Microbacterium]|uniref:metalloregulator ArsR/SmtB family transcription factor n=1 Tax=Microbacterium TaxID=33882 RepID=UPI003BA16CF8